MSYDTVFYKRFWCQKPGIPQQSPSALPGFPAFHP